MDNVDNPARIIALERSGILMGKLQGSLERICKRVKEELDVDCSQVNVADAHDLMFVAEWPRPHRWRKPKPLSTTGCHEVVVSEQTVVIPDTHTHPVVCVMSWVQDWRGYLGSPILYATETIGSLCVLTKEVRDWTRKDVALLDKYSAEVSALL